MKTLILLGLSFFLTFSAQAETRHTDFALGCFWCAEHDFSGVKGVLDVVSGYEGGSRETATYEQVSRGDSGHYETVRVTYNDAQVSYEDLLQVFWDNVDPFDAAGQFCDKGTQYSAIIFAGDKSERVSAETSLKELQARHTDQKVAVQILDSKEFYPAEAYHQNYAENNKVGYKLYRTACRRDARLEELKE